MTKYFIFKLLMISLLLIGCSHKSNYDSRKVSGFSYKSYYENVFLAGQPTPAQLESLKRKENVNVVINLRSEKEIDGLYFDPKASANALNITYYNLPFFKKNEIDNVAVETIESIFMFHHKRKEKVLVYCSSGNRAAAWLTTHFVNQHGFSIEKALKEGEAAGLRSTLAPKVRKYLYENSKLKLEHSPT